MSTLEENQISPARGETKIVANTMPGDRILFIKSSSDSAHAFTLQGNASETIDGGNTKVSNTAAYSALEVISDGTQWLASVVK